MNEKAVLLWFIFLWLEVYPIDSSLSGGHLISWILAFYWSVLGQRDGPRWGSEMLVVPWVRSIGRVHQGSEPWRDWRCEIQRERLASQLESVLAEGLSWLEALEKDSEWKFKGNRDGTESEAEQWGREVWDGTGWGGIDWGKHESETRKNQGVKPWNMNLFRYWRKRVGQRFKEGVRCSETQRGNVIQCQCP